MIKRISAIIIKEFCHIMRDWQTLMIVILMPVVMMFLYGYALTMDLTEVPVMIVDPAPSADSRAVAASIDATTLFKVEGVLPVTNDPHKIFRENRPRAIIRFPVSFSSQLRDGGKGASIQVLVDGSDPNVGTILKNVMEPMLTGIILKNLGIEQPNVVSIDARVLYNPEQKSALFFIPGLMALILMMISALLTSLAITREKELGTMEQLLVSPLRPGEIVLGKIIPYIGLAAIEGFLILFISWAAFGVEIAGSKMLLAFACLIYIFTALSIGLLISTVASNQQQAMMIVLPVTMLPTIVLSGFIFPLTSIPWVLQAIAQIVPATYFLEIIRAIILKGIGIDLLWKPILLLVLIGFIVVNISIRKLRVRP